MKLAPFASHVLALAVVAAASPIVSNSAQAASTLIYCSEGSPEGFDPARFTAGTTYNASSQPLFNRLVEFEPGSTKVIPALAESWTISPDGLVYTFKLRKGVKFHTTDWFKPTRDFDADDVVFTFGRILKPDHPFNQAAPVEFEMAGDMGLPKNIIAVEALDGMTVRFRLQSVDAALLADLAMDFASVQSAEYAAQLLKNKTPFDINTKPIGTGPFVFRRYEKDAQIRFTAFDGYWRGRAKIDNLIFAITPDSAVRLQKLRANECQVSVYPKPAELEALRNDKNIVLLREEGLNVGYLSLNVKKPPLDKVEVRRAINMAINKKSLVDAVYQGGGQVAINPMPPTLWGYDKSIKDYAYDPVAAKALLVKAGLPNGFAIKLWALPVQRPYNPNGTQSAELIQSDLAKIGIRAEIMKYEWAEYLKRAKQGESEIGMFGWNGDNGDPDNFLNSLLSCGAIGGGNYGQWCNKEFDDLVTRAKQVADQGQRTKLYEQAQVVAKREAPWVPMAHSVVFQPVRSNVIGYRMSPLASVNFYPVSLK